MGPPGKPGAPGKTGPKGIQYKHIITNGYVSIIKECYTSTFQCSIYRDKDEQSEETYLCREDIERRREDMNFIYEW